MKVQEWQVYVLKTEFDPTKDNFKYETKLNVCYFFPHKKKFSCYLHTGSDDKLIPKNVYLSEKEILKDYQPMLEDKRIVSPVYKQGKEAFVPGR